MAPSNPSGDKDRSVRVQLFAHDAVKNKNTAPLKAFRLRTKATATFHDLANLALARYAREDHEVGEIGSILDGADCAVDLEETVDLINSDEILKLVLAPKGQTEVISISSDHSGSDEPPTTVSYPHPSQRPAVKRSLARGPSLTLPGPPSQRYQPPSSQKKPAAPQPNPSHGTAPCSQTSITHPDVASEGWATGAKSDPYEIPSDSEQPSVRSSSVQRGPDFSGRRGPFPKRAKHQNNFKAASTTSPVASRERSSIPRNATIITIADSVESSNESATPMSQYKTAAPAKQNNAATAPSHSSSAHTSRWPKHRASAPSPSQEQMDVYAARLRAEEEKDRKAREERAKKANRPKEAISYIKKITKTKPRRTIKKELPKKFFLESDHSDDDFGETISSPHPLATDDVHSGGCQASARLPPQLPNSSGSSIKPTTSFRPINTLSTTRNSEPPPVQLKKFGLGYPLHVRERFNDEDDEDVGDTHEFTHWVQDCVTNFVAHPGFCSVADGPFKGLIRGGPDDGKYLPGFSAPTQQHIAEMRRAAVRKERWIDMDSSVSDAAPGDAESEDMVQERHPLKTPSFTQSEPTSILITKQLSQEEPPSNQELAILMSSSPSRAGAESRLMPVTDLCTSNIDDTDANNREASLELPTCLPSFLPPNAPECDRSTPSRYQRPSFNDADLDVTPTFERALSQMETPSTRSRSAHTSSAPSKKDDDIHPSSTGHLVVKIHELSAEKQAEYRKMPDDYRQPQLGRILRPFKEINGGHRDSGNVSQDSSTSAIEHVLRESPMWLANITELEPRTPTKAPTSAYTLRSMRSGTASGTESATRGKKRKEMDNEHDDPTYRAAHQVREPDPLGCPVRTSCAGAEQATKTTPRSKSKQSGNALRAPTTTSQPEPDFVPDTPQNKAGLSLSKPEFISTTPIPAPSISDLMQKIRGNRNIPTASGTTASPVDINRKGKRAHRHREVHKRHDGAPLHVPAVKVKSRSKPTKHSKHRRAEKNGKDKKCDKKSRKNISRQHNEAKAAKKAEHRERKRKHRSMRRQGAEEQSGMVKVQMPAHRSDLEIEAERPTTDPLQILISDRHQKNSMAHESKRPKGRILSPPATSRPSSAGSRM
ncbi:uncharacterized protein JN550_012628 [Neoarthrinium moseri]|uniref:uncharacterized protein n=1 Tax=Neoarthrinium moseri TaxID=1658444 RepID=UPI001FDAEC33|nr:uncharacterized protein JN550_012628 [Neoarthrinium moseri]KAI1858495.1 hypothetical protein JN550_012628 [Neoarthrinium moseri]